jgi:hypothetical protein
MSISAMSPAGMPPASRQEIQLAQATPPDASSTSASDLDLDQQPVAPETVDVAPPTDSETLRLLLQQNMIQPGATPADGAPFAPVDMTWGGTGGSITLGVNPLSPGEMALRAGYRWEIPHDSIAGQAAITEVYAQASLSEEGVINFDKAGVSHGVNGIPIGDHTFLNIHGFAELNNQGLLRTETIAGQTVYTATLSNGSEVSLSVPTGQDTLEFERQMALIAGVDASVEHDLSPFTSLIAGVTVRAAVPFADAAAEADAVGYLAVTHEFSPTVDGQLIGSVHGSTNVYANNDDSNFMAALQAKLNIQAGDITISPNVTQTTQNNGTTLGVGGTHNPSGIGLGVTYNPATGEVRPGANYTIKF